MDVIALCPFAVGTLVWQARPDEWTLTVLVKATFALRAGGEAAIASEQIPLGDERAWDDAASSARAGGVSVHAPGDFAPFKPRADIVLVGHAHAPGRTPAPAVTVALKVGDFAKSLRVHGHRAWARTAEGWAPGQAQPFTRMPLRWELAARSPDNPVGIDPQALGATGVPALPNIEAIDDGRAPRSAGLGPIASGWASRQALVGEAARAWAQGFGAAAGSAAAVRGSGPDRPAPSGLDFGYFNAAPRDQQVDLLRPGAITLENLHPEHPHLETRLPGVRPKVFVPDPATRRPREVALRCDTLWIDADRGLVTLTWRGLTSIASGDERSLPRVVVVVEEKGKPVRLAGVDRLLKEGATPGALAEAGEDGGESSSRLASTQEEPNPLNVRHDAVKPLGRPPHLPFGEPPAEPVTRELPARAPASRAQARSAGAGARASREESTQEIAIPTLRRDALPFRGAAPPDAPVRAEAERGQVRTEPPPRSEHTAEVRLPPEWPATPFTAPRSPTPTTDTISDGEDELPTGNLEATGELEVTRKTMPPAADAVTALPFAPPAPRPAGQAADDDATTAEELDDAATPLTARPVVARRSNPPAAPARSGAASPVAEARQIKLGGDAAGALGRSRLGATLASEGRAAASPVEPAASRADAAAQTKGNPPAGAAAATMLRGRQPPGEPAAATPRGRQPPGAPAATVPQGCQLPGGPAATVQGERQPPDEPAAPSLERSQPSGERPAPLRGSRPGAAPAAPPPAAAPAGPPPPGSQPEATPEGAPAARRPEDVTVEQYATVAAELAERKGAKPAVLLEHGFTDATWSAVDGRWRSAIQREVERGHNELLTAFDAAYLAAQERFRDPIGVPDYARIVVGVERGEVGRILGQLKLQLSDLMRLQRVWTRRVADDPKLAAELGAAVEAARAGR